LGWDAEISAALAAHPRFLEWANPKRKRLPSWMPRGEWASIFLTGLTLMGAFAQILGLSFFQLVGGQTYTYAEIRRWLTGARIGKVQLNNSIKASGLFVFVVTS
jgi:hypothetical protein